VLPTESGRERVAARASHPPEGGQPQQDAEQGPQQPDRERHQERDAYPERTVSSCDGPDADDPDPEGSQLRNASANPGSLAASSVSIR
jgi:hypothetical protein